MVVRGRFELEEMDSRYALKQMLTMINQSSYPAKGWRRCDRMSGNLTLSMVYDEVKKLTTIDSLEELIEEIVMKELPKTKLSKREDEEIKKSLEEMKRREYAALEELMNA